MTRIALLRSGLIGAAATTTGAELPAGWRLDERSADLIHVDSGLRFPAEWKGMRRDEPATFDDMGLNVAIRYDGATPRVALTLYVYPREFGGIPDPERHFTQAVQAALQASPGSRVEGAARVDVPLGDATVPGFNAFLFLRWPDAAEAGSFLVLIPHEHRFLKLRVTFDVTGDAALPSFPADASQNIGGRCHLEPLRLRFAGSVVERNPLDALSSSGSRMTGPLPADSLANSIEDRPVARRRDASLDVFSKAIVEVSAERADAEGTTRADGV